MADITYTKNEDGTISSETVLTQDEVNSILQSKKDKIADCLDRKNSVVNNLAQIDAEIVQLNNEIALLQGVITP